MDANIFNQKVEYIRVMDNTNYQHTFIVPVTRMEVYDAITRVTEWWTLNTNGTQLSFTHIGLTPGVECYAQCEKGWNYFIGISLFKLITEGAGVPDTSERKHFDTTGHVRSRNA